MKISKASSKIALLMMAATISLSFEFSPETKICSGAFPQNKMKIPVGTMKTRFDQAGTESGISKKDFNEVIDVLQEIYTPEVSAKGVSLKFSRLWESAEVNAMADRNAKEWIVIMHGGLARHEMMTKDTFALVACHELGHHLGGAPKNPNWNRWSSVEGNADYYAVLKCFRKYADRVSEKIDQNDLEKFAAQACEKTYPNQQEKELCLRSLIAGSLFVKVFAEASDEAVSFATPDTYVVKMTRPTHPESQCRLDTFFNGALCSVSADENVSDTDYQTGTCTAKTHKQGLRPLCWFKPSQ